MKKIILLLVTILSLSTFSQDKETDIIYYTIDDFNEDKKFSAGGVVAYTDGGDLRTEGMSIWASIKEKKGEINKYYTVIATVYGMKTNCIDKNSYLQIIFENGEKSTLINWYKFNCDGLNFFNISRKDYKLLNSSKIKALKYTDKRTYESIVVKENITEEIASYFINLNKEIKQINNKELKIKIKIKK
jgi:hypothetical protein